MQLHLLIRRGAACVIALAATTAALAQTAMVRTEHAYPTGSRANSVILLERFMPGEVRTGEDFSYQLKLTNLTNAPVEFVRLIETYPPAFSIASIDPQPESNQGGKATWSFRQLEPRESRTFTFRGTGQGTGELRGCAEITFATSACSATRLVQPALELTKTAPPEAMICDPIPIEIVVTNTGTGIARDVTVTDTLPAGWQTTDGRDSFVAEVGNLAAGQSRTIKANVRSSRTGEFTNTAMAKEAGGLTAQDSSTTIVRQPVLTLSKNGPTFRYLNRPATYELTVRNTGNAPARNTTLVDTLPQGATFVEATDGGRAAGNQVTWNLGTLAPGATKTVGLTLVASRVGHLRNVAQARAYCAEADAEATLEVRGIPAVLLEVVDIADPIEIGRNETYEITVVNQGSAEGTNIVITCTLPAEQEYVSAEGPTKATVSGKQVKFAPLADLPPKAAAKYRVIIKATGAGDVRFKTSLTSDQVDSPVEETESTHQY